MHKRPRRHLFDPTGQNLDVGESALILGGARITKVKHIDNQGFSTHDGTPARAPLPCP